MIDAPLEQALFMGALAALANHHAAWLDGELGELAETLLRAFRPRAKA
jgi:hypothetical protein